jgi:hypothetical protein
MASRRCPEIWGWQGKFHFFHQFHFFLDSIANCHLRGSIRGIDIAIAIATVTPHFAKRNGRHLYQMTPVSLCENLYMKIYKIIA